MRRIPYLIFFAIFLIQWLFLFTSSHPDWDGVYYYSYARSIILDGDLRLANDFQFAYPFTSEQFVNRAFHTVTTETGYVYTPFAIGTSVVWMPWLALTRLFGRFDGYEPLVLAVQSVMPAFAGLIAYILSFRIAKQIVPRNIAAFSVATVMWVTPLIYYQFSETFYSHTMSALLTTLCVGYWWRNQDDRATYAFTLGIWIGFAALIRWQNSVYLLLIGVPAAIDSVKNFRTLPLATRNVLLTVAGYLSVMTIQMAMWKIFYNSWITVPQGESFFDWSAPRIWPTLFSTYRGLLFWMPIFFPALIGIIILCRRRLAVGLPLLCILLFEVYVNGSTLDWFGGGGFGPRRFTSELSIIIIGYAVLLDALRLRQWMMTALGILFALPHWVLLRFGIPEQIGGRITVFVPDYTWEEDTILKFLGKISHHLPKIWENPRAFWLNENAPLNLLWNGQSIRWQLFGLAVAGLMWVGIVWLGRHLPTRHPLRTILLVEICVGCLVAWILFV